MLGVPCPVHLVRNTVFSILLVEYIKLSICGLPKALRNAVMFAGMPARVLRIPPRRRICVNVLWCNFRIILYRVRCLYFKQLALLVFTRCSSKVDYGTFFLRLLFFVTSHVSFELLCLPVPLNTDMQIRVSVRTAPTLPLSYLLLALHVATLVQELSPPPVLRPI